MKAPHQLIVQKKRKAAQKEHCSAARREDVQAKQVPPTPSNCSPYRPDFMPRDWIKKFNNTVPRTANLHWSTFAALYPVNLRINIPEFLDRVADLMIQHSADCDGSLMLNFLWVTKSNTPRKQVGGCNVKSYEDYNDYGDHLYGSISS
jgi:hypothetical protein